VGTNLPSSNAPALTWLEARIASWLAAPGAIGLTSAQVTSLATDINNARASFTSVQTLRADAKDGTVAFDTKATTMRKNASLLIADVKAFANAAPIPNDVYVAASISPKDPPSPVPAPEQPTIDGAVLGGDGSVTINFSGRGATGTVWEVSRKLAGETSFSHVGHADSLDKSFTDNTVPGTVSSATYRMQGLRGTQSGPFSFSFNVQFGTADGAAAAAA
jgi:hypothetical protein